MLWGQGQEALRPGSPPDPSRLPSVRVGGSAPCGCAWSLTGSSRRELGVLPRWELAPSVEPSPTEHTSCLGGHCPFLGFPGGVVCSGAVIPASQRSSLSVCLRQFELAVEFLVLWSCLVCAASKRGLLAVGEDITILQSIGLGREGGGRHCNCCSQILLDF